MTDDFGSSAATKKRRSFTIDQKLEVVQYAKQTSRNAASRQFGIARHCVSQWLKTEEELSKLQASTSETPAKRRRPGAGRRVKNDALDDNVSAWIREELMARRPVSRARIQEKALEMYAESNGTNGKEFKASTGWLEKFLLRHNLQSRRDRGIQGTNTPSTSTRADNAPTNLANFVARLKEQRGYRRVYVAYRIVLFIDSFGTVTMGRKDGEFSSSLQSSDKIQVTIVLTASDSGHKFQPFVLLPADSQSSTAASTFVDQLHLLWTERADLDEHALLDYLKRVFGEDRETDERRLLLWNQFGCQMTEELSELLDQVKVDNQLIPTGSGETKKILSSTLSLPFTNHLLSCHQNWSLHGEKESTSNGNLGPLSMNLFLGWIQRSWMQVEEERIREMFTDNDDGGDVQWSEYIQKLGELQWNGEVAEHSEELLERRNGPTLSDELGGAEDKETIEDLDEQMNHLTDATFLEKIMEEVNKELEGRRDLTNFINDTLLRQ